MSVAVNFRNCTYIRLGSWPRDWTTCCSYQVWSLACRRPDRAKSYHAVFSPCSRLGRSCSSMLQTRTSFLCHCLSFKSRKADCRRLDQESYLSVLIQNGLVKYLHRLKGVLETLSLLTYFLRGWVFYHRCQTRLTLKWDCLHCYSQFGVNWTQRHKVKFHEMETECEIEMSILFHKIKVTLHRLWYENKIKESPMTMELWDHTSYWLWKYLL